MEIVLLAFLGWLMGVWINRAADNLPVRRSLVAAPQCPYCGSPRPMPDQIALFNFLSLRGHCSRCHAPISLRAPLLEIACIFLLPFLWARYGGGAQFLLAIVYSLVFLLVLVTDLEHRLIFNVVILPATLFAVLASPISRLGIPRSLLGGIIAFVIVLSIYLFAILFARARKISVPGGAFGQGDVKLATFVGIVVGFPAVLPTILYTILLGGAGAILFLAVRYSATRRLALSAAIPYGPFFCIAGWWMMVFGI